MTELQKFDALLKKTLSISKEELQRRIDAAAAKKQASVRVRAGKG